MADDVLIGDTPKARRRESPSSGTQDGRPSVEALHRRRGREGLYRREELDGLFVFTLLSGTPGTGLVSYYH